MKSFHLIKPYFYKNRYRIIIGIICLITVDMLQLFIPRIVKWAIDDLTTFKIDSEKLAVYAFYIIMIAMLIGNFRYIWRRCLIGLSRQVEEGIRNNLFHHIQTLSASYFSKTKTGDLMVHATNDIVHIRMATGMGVVALTDSIVLGSAAIGFMLYINVKLTLLAIAPMPFIAIFTKILSKIMHGRYKDVQQTYSKLTEVVRERFAGIRIIKSYHMEDSATEMFNQISREYINQNLRLTQIVGSFFPLMIMFTNISLIIVLYFGGSLTIMSDITAGDFVAFISYLGILTWPMMAIGWVTNLLQRGRASLDRINKIIITESEIADTPETISIKKIKKEIRFSDIHFFYNEDNVPVLKNINLQMDRGMTLGIVGPPGGGKTTLVNLLARIYQPKSGHILIDTNDIKKINLYDYKSMLSFLPQEPFLFAGTIRQNITFGDPSVSDSYLEEISHQAKIFDTILSLPKGFETIVGEKGIILSGGQKQRIALARALLKPSEILILDDPISQVDTQTGHEITENIKSCSGKKTIIIVSHRYSAVEYADRIIVLDKGTITESGNHDQLMSLDKYYAHTYRMQKYIEA